MSKSTISTFQLFEMFPDEETARVYLESRLWPEGPFCPVCGIERSDHRPQGRLLSLQPVQGGFHRPHRDDLRAVACSAAQVDLRDVPRRHRAQGHLVDAARQGDWRYPEDSLVRPRAAPRGMRRQLDELRGIVEIDETYIGGKEATSTRGRSSTPGAARSAKQRCSVCGSAAVAQRQRW